MRITGKNLKLFRQIVYEAIGYVEENSDFRYGKLTADTKLKIDKYQNILRKLDHEIRKEQVGE